MRISLKPTSKILLNYIEAISKMLETIYREVAGNFAKEETYSNFRREKIYFPRSTLRIKECYLVKL